MIIVNIIIESSIKFEISLQTHEKTVILILLSSAGMFLPSISVIGSEKRIFLKKMFRLRDREIEEAVVSRIYEMFRGITWYLQLMMNELFTLTASGGVCSADLITVAISNVILIQQHFYKEILAALPLKQKSLLYAIAKEKVALNLTSQTFIRRNALASASSVQSALKGLKDKDLVVDVDGGVAIYDVFFERFIQSEIL